ncbi:hypothetical protein MN608_05661 [Microdochium nivale]|nr:hypothetical protein MN608_05661 [Microdochium nivale]
MGLVPRCMHTGMGGAVSPTLIACRSLCLPSSSRYQSLRIRPRVETDGRESKCMSSAAILNGTGATKPERAAWVLLGDQDHVASLLSRSLALAHSHVVLATRRPFQLQYDTEKL